MNDPPSGNQVALACTRCDWKGPQAEAACDGELDDHVCPLCGANVRRFTFLVPREWFQEADLILVD